MSSSLVSQLKDAMPEAAAACALALESGDEPFFKKLEWWLADGAFNFQPFGMFRTNAPYRQGDERTVGQFLAQETRHRWEGTNQLRDLFDRQVVEVLNAWGVEHLTARLGAAMPSAEEWDEVYASEWEEALMVVGLHPSVPENAWEEFLRLPLASVIEQWREHASQVAKSRARHAARLVSRQQMEMAVIETIGMEFERARSQAPEAPLMECLAGIARQHSAFEVAVFVRASSFTSRLQGPALNRLHQAYPLPPDWRQNTLDEEEPAV